MKRLITVFCMLSASLIFGQKTTTPAGSFEITKNHFPEKQAFYTEAISKSNLETYRLKNTRVTLEFQNGFQLVLLSAKEMFVKGFSVNMNDYKETQAPNVPRPKFTVSENGWITAEIQTTGKSSSK